MLPGPQTQRLAMARAPMNRPEPVFADAPTGKSDREPGDQVMEVGLRAETSAEHPPVGFPICAEEVAVRGSGRRHRDDGRNGSDAGGGGRSRRLRPPLRLRTRLVPPGAPCGSRASGVRVQELGDRCPVGAPEAPARVHALQRRRRIGKADGLGLALAFGERECKGAVPDVAGPEGVDRRDRERGDMRDAIAAGQFAAFYAAFEAARAQGDIEPLPASGG